MRDLTLSRSEAEALLSPELCAAIVARGIDLDAVDWNGPPRDDERPLRDDEGLDSEAWSQVFFAQDSKAFCTVYLPLVAHLLEDVRAGRKNVEQNVLAMLWDLSLTIEREEAASPTYFRHVELANLLACRVFEAYDAEGVGEDLEPFLQFAIFVRTCAWTLEAHRRSLDGIA